MKIANLRFIWSRLAGVWCGYGGDVQAIHFNGDFAYS
jgi:hypothetical protein